MTVLDIYLTVVPVVVHGSLSTFKVEPSLLESEGLALQSCISAKHCPRLGDGRSSSHRPWFDLQCIRLKGTECVGS